MGYLRGDKLNGVNFRRQHAIGNFIVDFVSVRKKLVIEQVFFTVKGGIIKVNGADVQVFEYETAEQLKAEASQVAPDGGSTGTTMITWAATPHFFKAGRVHVLYVGDDQVILDLLEGALGSQFAGR